MIQIKGPTDAVEAGFDAPYHGPMFTIEHDFDATVITLIDEGESPLAEDVIVEAFEDCVVIEQLDAETDIALRITLSLRQIKDLAAALDLPEGIYRRK
jgi:hypothetical protein